MKHIILGTAGHIDHGKTMLIKALTGINCDTHKQEKEQGITINLGFAHLDFDDGFSIGIVDVPGHKDFIKTMIAGASGIKMFLLVVAANEGIMPQTTEHITIIKSLNIKHGVVALTKCDIADEIQIQNATIQTQKLFSDFEFSHISIVPVSANTGKGLDTLKKHIYDVAHAMPDDLLSQEFRMYVDRHFMPKGTGSVVTGSVIGGNIGIGDTIYILPAGVETTTKSLQRHGKAVTRIFTGDRAAIQFSGLKNIELQKGMLVSNTLLSGVTLADAVIRPFVTLTKINLWTQVIFLCGTFEIPARMHLLNSNRFTTQENILVQLHFQQAIVILTGDHFIIRNSSDNLTLGGGTIIDNQPLHHKRRTKKMIANLEQLQEAILKPAQRFWLIKNEIEKRQCAIPLSLATKISKIEDNKIIKYLSGIATCEFTFVHHELQTLISTKELDETYKNKLIKGLENFHKKNLQLSTGLNFQAIQQQLKLNNNEGKLYLLYIIEELISVKKIKINNNTYVSFTHQIEQQSRNPLAEKIIAIIKEFKLQTTVNTEKQKILKTLNISEIQLNKALQEMAHSEQLLHINNDYLLINDVERCRKQLLQHLYNKPQGINEKEMRELLGCSKRIGQMLLDFFIKEKIAIMQRTFYICITELGKQKI